MKTFAISIPKPCHEDWNKMTPDAKGAFCASCQKSVHDFSKKSDEEIIEVFEKEEEGNVCGRFTPAQLSRPVVSFGNPTITSRLAIFAYALLLVFGAALFNGADAYGQEVKGKPSFIKMGTVAVEPIEPVIEEVKDTVIEVKEPERIQCGLNVRGERNVEMMLGQSIVIDTPSPTIYGETIAEESLTVTGDTVIMPATNGIDTIAVNENILPAIDSIIPVENIEMHVLGGLRYIEVVETEPLQIEETAVDTIVEATEEPIEDKLPLVIEKVILPPMELEVKVSPNPSSGQITLSYTLENTMAMRIELFDITGKMVKTLNNQGKQYAGKYNVSYNIADLPNGIYMATLTTEEDKVTSKIILTR